MIRVTMELDVGAGADEEIGRKLCGYMGGKVVRIRVERLQEDVARLIRENEKICRNCYNCGRELWPKKKIAFRCLGSGMFHGRTVTVCENAYEKSEMENLGRPMWCPGFVERKIEYIAETEK